MAGVSTGSNNNNASSSEPVTILGVVFDDERGAKDDVRSHILITYRMEFEALGSGWRALTSDAGWGCMHRSMQMLIAEAYLRRTLGRDWRKKKGKKENSENQKGEEEEEEDDDFGTNLPREFTQILELFQDAPSAPYGIHRIATYGASCAGKSIGEWFGPNTACTAISAITKDLVKQQQQQQGGRREEEEGGGGAAAKKESEEDEGVVVFGISPPSSISLPILPIVIGQDAAIYFSDAAHVVHHHPESPFIVLLPLRHGAEELDVSIIHQILAALRFKESLGFVGGRENAAFWCLGSQGRGPETSMWCLDPHDIRPFSSKQDPSTYIPLHATKIPIGRVDPSLALGFYCENRSGFERLLKQLEQLGGPGSSMRLVSVGETRPDYGDVGSWADEDEEEDEDGFVVM